MFGLKRKLNKKRIEILNQFFDDVFETTLYVIDNDIKSKSKKYKEGLKEGAKIYYKVLKTLVNEQGK